MIEIIELTDTETEKEIKFIEMLCVIQLYKAIIRRRRDDEKNKVEPYLLSNNPENVIELYYGLPEEVRLVMMMKNLERR